jgi:hypothetical protein
MFNGPYMISEVNHSISPGEFSTDFKGIRQPTASLPKIDNYLQALKTNLVSKINEVITQEKDVKTAQNPTNIQGLSSQAQTLLATNSNTINSNQTCTPTITRYERFINESPTRNEINALDARNIISEIVLVNITEQNKEKKLLLAISIFAKLYIGSRSSQPSKFQAYGYNFSGLDLKSDWGDLTPYTDNKFFCSNNNTPYLIFGSLNKNVEFLKARWEPRMLNNTQVPTGQGAELGIGFITKFVVENGFNNISEGTAFYNKIKQDGTLSDYNKVVTEAFNLWDSLRNR